MHVRGSGGATASTCGKHVKDELRALGSAPESATLRSECDKTPPTLEVDQRRPPTSVAEALKNRCQRRAVHTGSNSQAV
jgi:hypothetical protein